MPTVYDSKNDEEHINNSINEEIDYPPPPTQVKPKDINDKKEIKSPSSDEIELDRTAQGSRRILFKTRTIFPFDFFPDELIIDENKIDIISGIFFFSKDVFSIPIGNISGVNSSFDLFFGQLRIEAWGLNKNPLPIRFLTKKDAQKARRIISGLILTTKNDIDLKSIPLAKTKLRLEQIGVASNTTK